ncbi:M42 family metallopeptidase [Alkaliphilus peptidifermentans]|uniref:Endoglucanase n=1 Tax=Alkaliphilus peptidifermentans DSM 18978 TaxID=1120976 RepID=A0A1G5KL33_9FIRM|nr:M42 family metallopeptidase [Alkaliphilus peptidifermentans]SCZ01292.1 endoglucanase [Alkaliphilus peptidifermentans DSM 18978]
MLLEKLTGALSLSGNEKAVRNIVLEEIKGYVDEIKVDRMGNVIAVKKGTEEGTNIALVAHMDEVGLMVKGIDKNGLLKFAAVGGIDARILVSKPVIIGENKIPGVIGSKAVHMQKPDERKKALSIDDLYIDIGSKDKKETEKEIAVGDFIYFDSDFVEFGKNRIKAKSLDDRVGCAIIIDILKQPQPVTVTGIFTVQEEIGLRGAEVAANQVDVDLAIIIEGTTCSDVSEVDPHSQVTALDAGPAISIMDRTSIYNRRYIDLMIEVAKKNNIPWQYRKSSFGGNDAGRFHTAKGGTPCVSIAVPCRYIHSPVSVLSKDDYNNTQALLIKFIEKMNRFKFES